MIYDENDDVVDDIELLLSFIFFIPSLETQCSW